MTTQKIAGWISNFGHPMLTFPLFIIVMLFLKEPFGKAILISSLIILGIFVPMFIKMRRGTQSGKYTNFDISDQQQRKSFYPFVIILLTAVTAILYYTNQPQNIISPLFWALMLILVNYALNFFIKVSLHVSLTIFLGFLIYENFPVAGIAFFIYSIAMAWSRWKLKRHSPNEILLGAFIGILIGTLYSFNL